MSCKDDKSQPLDATVTIPQGPADPSWAQCIAEWQASMAGQQSKLGLIPAALYSGSPQLAGLLETMNLAALGQGLGLYQNVQPPIAADSTAQQHDVSNESVPFPRSPQKRSSDSQLKSAQTKRSRIDELSGKVEENDNSSITAPSPASIIERQGPRPTLKGKSVRRSEDPLLGADSGLGNGDEAENIPQDDRDTKRLRRKQSNRESARRSRMRKQQECEALSSSVTGLQQENQKLKEENRSLQAKVVALTELLTLDGGKNSKNCIGPSAGNQKTSAFNPVPQKASSNGRLLELHKHSVHSNLDTLSAAAAVHHAFQDL